MNLYPFIDNANENSASKSYGKDVKWDFEKNVPVYDAKGNPVFVSGVEAVLSWSYRALSTERYAHKLHVRSYGNEIFELIGKCPNDGILNSEAQRMIKECLCQNGAVKVIKNFTHQRDGDKVVFTFRIETIYGEEDMKLEY